MIIGNISIQFKHCFLSSFRGCKSSNDSWIIIVATHCYALNLLRHCCSKHFRLVHRITVLCAPKRWAGRFKLLVTNKEEQPVFNDWTTESKAHSFFTKFRKLTAIRIITNIVFIAFNVEDTAMKFVGSGFRYSGNGSTGCVSTGHIKRSNVN